MAYLLRSAKYAQEFLLWVGDKQFRNPDTGNEVKFTSLPPAEQTRIYEQWAQQAQEPKEQPEQDKEPAEEEEDTRQSEEPAKKEPAKEEEPDTHQAARDAALHGQITETKALSESDDKTLPGVNLSEIVTIEHNGKQRKFLRKPAAGEANNLRIGIPAGSYHAREQAFYDFDSLLGGRTVVPVTVSRGPEDGSYQQWAQGAHAMDGNDLDHLARIVKPEDLSRSPDFHRLNLLDLLLGHEDRHRGNVLYHFDGDETPENLRLIAIDNGLSLATPGYSPDHRVYRHPFGELFEIPEDPSEEEEAADEARVRSNAAIADSLLNLPEELRTNLKNIDLNKVAQTITKAGVHHKKALRALLVRLAALQHDPSIFRTFLAEAEKEHDPLQHAWRSFQHLSGQENELLERAGAPAHLADTIDNAVDNATPPNGWTNPWAKRAHHVAKRWLNEIAKLQTTNYLDTISPTLPKKPPRPQP